MKALGDLWRGRLPLGQAFWLWAVAIGAAANVAATGASMGALAAGWPGGLALALHLAPVPFNAATAVGVWRSAATYAGPRLHAEAARVAVAAWTVLLTLI